MKTTLFFYDLETSGVDPREQRIMQFAGQRTDLDLNEIDEPFNILIKLTDDILPDPYAIMVTGILPQKTFEEGVTEAEFLRVFTKDIATPDTIFIGYNTIRFDDEFMRYMHYRNFYDPYEWHWKDGRSRWDLLDAVRMTRALRPEGIKWPFSSEGKPTNRLELLTGLNKLEHSNAHDAFSDVRATIALARLLKDKQPRLFDYLLNLRNKTEVERLVKSQKPFVYSSGKYSNEYEKTTIAVYLADNPKSGALVYDLRFEPTMWLDKSADELADAWKWHKDNDKPRLPIKTLQYNRCPAIAPTSVLDDESKKRLAIDMREVAKNHQILINNPQFTQEVLKALEILNQQQQLAWQADPKLVDAQLYDGFFDNADKQIMAKIRDLYKSSISETSYKFNDVRLQALLPLYKARNLPNLLTTQDRKIWEEYRISKFYSGGEQSRVNKYFNQLQELAEEPKQTANNKSIIEDLRLYGESILPDTD